MYATVAVIAVEAQIDLIVAFIHQHANTMDKLECFCYLAWRPHDAIFICLDTVPERDGQTELL